MSGLPFVVLLAMGLAIQVAALTTGSVATASESVAAVMRTLPGRMVVLTAWLWLGIHFLAR